MARAPIEEVEGLDEEFLYHLNRGADLLAKGDAEAARAALERASELRPKDAKVLGLLGQACYRLGRFEQAVVVYGRLVDDNPVEAGARVNLGLANLKAKRYPDAVKQLTIALDLNPDHPKAMGYLGLALLESGDPRRARDWFAKAGSEQMVARCDEAIASRGAAAAALPRPPPEDAAEPIHAAPLPGGAPAPSSAAPLLASFAATRLVAPGSGEVFSSDGRILTVSVRGEVTTRIDGLFAALGALQMVPAMKRFRGRATDNAFGEGARRMHRVSGAGSLLYAASGRRFTSLDLGAEAGYFREEVVFAFEESVVFENGRVPVKGGPDLNLVHLRGPGRFLLATAGEPAAVEVSAPEPLRVPSEALVGWLGALTPRVVALGEPAPGAAEPADAAGPVMVELSGEGRALLDPAAARPRQPGD